MVPNSAASPICLVDETHDNTAAGRDASETERRKRPSAATSGGTKKTKRETKSSTSSRGKAKTQRKVASASNSSPSLFQTASYNIWFGPHGSDDLVHPKARMTAIVDELRRCHSKKSPLWVIGFQEVTAELAQILAPQLKSMGYSWHVQPYVMSMPGMYGCAIAVHNDLDVLESNFIPYSNTVQFRGILYVRTKSIFFATTHLESYSGPQFTGARERQVQAQEISEYCKEQLRRHDDTLQHAIFAGDLNWDDERTARSKSSGDNIPLLPLIMDDAEWIDAWLEYSKQDSTSQVKRALPGGIKMPTGYTYDAKENPMLGGNLRRRFDRCLVLSSQLRKNKIHKFELLGKEAIPNLTYNKRNPYNGSTRTVPVAPSDHFGIAVTLGLHEEK